MWRCSCSRTCSGRPSRPATKDVAGWWGGTLRDVRAAVASLGDRLATVAHDGATLLVHADAESSAEPSVVLLPAFDEFLLGHKDRSAVLAARHATSVVPGGNGVFAPTVLVDGQVVARPVLVLVATADHRIVDGAHAGQMATIVRDLVTHPERLDHPPR